MLLFRGAKPACSWIEGIRYNRIFMKISKPKIQDQRGLTIPQSMASRVQEKERNLNPAPSNPRCIDFLATDFDGTCSVGSCVDLMLMDVIRSAALTTGAADGSNVKEKLTTIAALSRQYSQELKSALESVMDPNLSKFDGEPGLLNEAKMEQILGAVSALDEKWNVKIQECRILEGAQRRDIIKAGRLAPLHAQVRQVLEKAQSLQWSVHVLSSNWSADYVAASLGENAISTRRNFKANNPGSILVHAKEFEYRQNMSTGNLIGSLTCPDDKRRYFVEMVKSHMDSKEQIGSTVYIGDSLPDLPTLLEADFGIILNADSALETSLSTIGMPVIPISEAPYKPETGCHPRLYRAETWEEVARFLFGPDGLGQYEVTRPCKIPRVLIIAGSDSGGGAGIQADIKTCMMTGSFATTAISSITSQNTKGVLAVHETPVEHLKSQMDAVLSDIGTDAVKTGVLPSPELVEAAAEKLKEYKTTCLVVDPVMISTSGDSLASKLTVEAFKTHLIPLATVLTPNISEAEELLGWKIQSLADMEKASVDLQALGASCVLLKGGHASANSGENPKRTIDVFCDGSLPVTLPHRTVKTSNTHGTGCTLASAIASALAQGLSPAAAVLSAQNYVVQALLASTQMKIGEGIQRPLNHGFDVTDWTSNNASMKRRMKVDVKLYAVTDPKINERRGYKLTEAVRLAIEGGATIVQIREKDASGGQYVRSVRECVEFGRRAGVPIIVNDRVDVALAAHADGIHVGQDDMCARDVRKMVGPNMIVGVSVSNMEEAIQAEADGADYLGAGAAYSSTTKPSSEAIGLTRLKEICECVSIPVVAIGGITPSNVGQVMESGCKGAAVVSTIFDTADIKECTEHLLQAINLG